MNLNLINNNRHDRRLFCSGLFARARTATTRMTDATHDMHGS